jgi:DNA-binding GntR family transcriptional regulator
MTAVKIANVLKSEILSGRLRPGEELSQGVIAGRFSVSRIPVRDALSLLSLWGLAEVVPRKSAHVRSLSPEEVHECFDLRVLIEADLLAHCIRRAISSDWSEIDRMRRQSDIEAEGPKWFDADLAFHQALYSPSGRRLEMGIVENLQLICQAQLAPHLSESHAPADWLVDHAAICVAGRRGDAESATEILTRHINKARDLLLNEMQR